ncbi:hypothetical protein Avbf_14801 [Armadillidium vulgare]|nr:hypothetical protein Avbf_14801 [Armadillidium vulgare]
MVIENISEVLSFSRKNKKVKERIHSTKKKNLPKNIEMLYRARVWINFHNDTKFRLNEKIHRIGLR